MPIYDMKTIHFKLPPSHFEINDDQDIFVVASSSDGVWINKKKDAEIDLDMLFGISDIRCIVYDSEE